MYYLILTKGAMYLDLEDIIKKIIDCRSSYLNIAYILASITYYQIKTNNLIIVTAVDISVMNF
jgi:hypothetical protein